MKKYVLFFVMLLSVQMAVAQSMSDQQVMEFIVAEAKAGTSQSQIVTKLMQRGVKIDQIRRLRQQYDKQISSAGQSAVADGAVNEAASRMRKNNEEQRTTRLSSYDRDDRNARMMADTAMVMRDDRYYNEPEETTGKKVFGRDIFNKRSLTFEPQMNIATPQNYVLGPGDEVVVDIYGASQKTETLTVSPDGTITVPDYGPIAVSGLTVAAAQAKLRRTLGSQYASSNLQLTVGQTRTIMVNVMGEVKAPGTYTLSAFATVFHALYMAGGISDLGTLRNVKVYRSGKLVTVVDIYEYILNGRLAGNIRLHDNDVIQVGTYESIVDIAGRVKRPMAYELRKNESLSTLMKFSGGFANDAYKKSLRVLRKNGRMKSVFNVQEFDITSFKMVDGDSVTVDSIIDRFENMVEVKGSVFRPGMYNLGDKVSSVRSLIEAADGLTEEAMVSRAVIRRMKANRTQEVVSVDLKGIMEGSSADVPLENEDILFIPTLAERQNLRTLSIDGEVIFPGIYEYAENSTIEDLILQAGGLTDNASTVKVDVARRIIDPSATTSNMEIAKTFSFSIKP
ncbi:MAG: SLBB domain-containing protein, partial [Prevotella sp.]|nr:SLBB domain-containing protein [Prevotella sp.]